MTRKQKKKFIKDLKERSMRGLAGTLAVYMFLTSAMIFAPSWWNQSYALTGGPSQPEVQSFEPIGTSDMVDLFSGDFTYNIPLLDVEGYPINLAYHSGVTMDQEASWVGLGWNVNVGTINRALRGLPDDFDGDKVITELNIKPNVTVGFDFINGDKEFFGKNITKKLDELGLSTGMNIGVQYNNYTGVGFSVGLTPKFKEGESNKLGVEEASLGINSSSSGGLSISPEVSLSYKLKGEDRKINSLGGKIGASFNSRGGLSNLSIGSNKTSDFGGKTKVGKILRKAIGKSLADPGSFDLMQPTYTPSITNNMNSFAVSGKFKIGANAILGLDKGSLIAVNYSQQKLDKDDEKKAVASYGYLYSHHGQDLEDARMDFNRENQSSVTPSTPNLALANYTYDIYSVSGQGVGGSYRPYRGQVGYVYNNVAKNSSSSVPFTAEIGLGSTFHLGGEVGVTIVNSQSGPWRKDTPRFSGENQAIDVLSFTEKGSSDDFENVVFREANEMSVSADQDYYEQFGGDEPAQLKLKNSGLYGASVLPELEKGANGEYVGSIDRAYTNSRIKRNNTIQDLTVEEVRSGFGVTPFIASSFAQTANMSDPDYPNYDNGHHLGQIVSLGTDGLRYIYGQPAYNKIQKEVTFAVGQKANGDDFPDGNVDYASGLVAYNPGVDNSKNNDWGLDNYFQRVTTPAYAHSYLLTAIVSDDYVDVDNVVGPSDNDLGSYTKFSYKLQEENYKWRVPVDLNKASFNEGLKGDPTDDKANYIYGEKELWYLEQIETKNFIAVFETVNREDAFGVTGENGGIDQNAPMQALSKISLYSKEDIRSNGGVIANATPLKEVHFVYDYELCQGSPNSTATGGGKLTLKQVYFTYRDSQKGKLSPYSFEYQNNYNYDLKAYDRWGNYKPNNVSSGVYSETDLATFEFPYVDQDQQNADNYTSAWTMNKVNLPSGGVIDMTYESDDYAYVQDKEAMCMAKIVNVGMAATDGQNGPNDPQAPDNILYKYDANNYYPNNMVKPISDNTSLISGDHDHKNRFIYFEKDPNISASSYAKKGDTTYFRCLMEFDKPDGTFPEGRYDYVSGYAMVEEVGPHPTDNSQGYIKFKPVSFNDKNLIVDKNPIALAGIQFGRLHLPRYVWDSPAFNENQTSLGALANSLFQTFANFVEGFKNPNQTIYDKNRGTKIVLGKSWVRLNNPTNKKLGGGCRVKQIAMNDNWAEMSEITNSDYDYGQEYSYTIENKVTINGTEYIDIKSSGVASYEPQLGGDENPFKQPIFHSDKKRMAPDDRFYQETPLGESFFPSASVGYSKVTVKNLTRFDDLNQNGIQDAGEETTVVKTATGEVVHEFYTANEFPTRVSKTELDPIRKKSDPFLLQNIFKIESTDFYTGSQGFVVETNDMHGKPKSQSVYQEGQDEPITKVEYFYQSKQGIKPGTEELVNSVKTISQDGIIASNDIGVNFDLVADFQESKTRIYNAGLEPNTDGLPFPGLSFIPTVWPSFSSEKTMFRSATLTKVIQKFGVLENTRATDLGSVVETKNLAYDEETGQVLLTETTTNFGDKVYSMNIPAYWYYDNMGPAYQNIGFTLENVQLYGGVINTSEAEYFVEGDELMVDVNGGSKKKMWVVGVDKNLGKITLQDKYGVQPTFLADKIEVSRSGRRNMQSQMMASVTTLTNPLNSFGDNLYENVLQASAIEFSDEWRTYCNCNGGAMISSVNPYVLGDKGNYRPKVSYLHLSDRTQSDYNDNTNLRKDGVFKSFAPYYQLNANGEWEVDRKDWTYTAEVTEFNPYGQELANEDALGRESAAQFGFNQTLAKAVAANAGYRDIGFSSFEDDEFSDCADNHFQFDDITIRESSDAHTGQYSIKVTSTQSVTLSRDLDRCEQSECSLTLDLNENQTLNTLTVSATGGTEPYYLDYNIISGNPSVLPSATGPLVLLSGTFQIEFDARDEEGCRSIEVVNVVNGNIVQ